LTADEAEEEFLRRDKTVNFFTLMVKKRLQANEEGEEPEKEKSSVSSRNMVRFCGSVSQFKYANIMCIPTTHTICLEMT